MSRKTAIDQFCKSCIYDKSQPGTWRQQVEACGAKTCPLYVYRPVSQPHPEKGPKPDLGEAISCKECDGKGDWYDASHGCSRTCRACNGTGDKQ